MKDADTGNLPPHANPCCGHVTDSAADIDGGQDLPTTDDFVICFNCGAILIYTEPERNLLRYARRIEIETLPREVKHKLSMAQRFIRRRGWLPGEAHRREGN